MPINKGEPFLAAIIWSGYFDEITPIPYEPSKDLTAFWTDSTSEVDDFISESIEWAITSVSVSDMNS